MTACVEPAQTEKGITTTPQKNTTIHRRILGIPNTLPIVRDCSILRKSRFLLGPARRCSLAGSGHFDQMVPELRFDRAADLILRR